MNTEPVVIITIIMSALAVIAEFGLPLTGSQETAIQALLVAIGALWARSKVSPTSSTSSTEE